MEKFEDIKVNFCNIKNNFCENVKDKVGVSINNEQLTPYEQSLNQMIMVENKANIEIMNINRLLLEARTILPRI